MPVHNEADSIEATLQEWFDYCQSQQIEPTFLISEDGSNDGTLNKIYTLMDKFEIKLITSRSRKGYSRAVVDAIKSSDEGIICCIDSDGQCDPKDLTKFLKILSLNENKIISGVRKPRLLYFTLFQINMRDTSCPFVVGFKSNFGFVSNKIFLDQGFWWEFHARRKTSKIQVIEVEINHRYRIEGVSRVYSIKSIFKIAIKHFVGLIKLRFELNRINL
jgi:glycosyltransferase involved in cell wall biosynthesis